MNDEELKEKLDAIKDQLNQFMHRRQSTKVKVKLRFDDGQTHYQDVDIDGSQISNLKMGTEENPQ